MAENITVIDPYFVGMHHITKHVASIFVSISFLLGVPGNILVILGHIRIKGKCTVDWMIFYLAVCDILSLMVLPVFIIQLEGFWSELGLPDVLCKLHIFNSNSASMSSYFFCACTALERFYKVVLSKDLFSIKQAQFMWLPGFMMCYGLGLLSYLTMTNNANGHCMVDVNKRTISMVAYGSVMVIALVSSLIMTVCYTCIGIYLLRRTKELTQSGLNENFVRRYQSTIQMTKMLAVVTIIFLLSADIPYITGFSIMIVNPNKEPVRSLIFFLSISFVVNNFINPFLYYNMNSSFRQRTKAILSIMCCSKSEMHVDLTESFSDSHSTGVKY